MAFKSKEKKKEYARNYYSKKREYALSLLGNKCKD